MKHEGFRRVVRALRLASEDDQPLTGEWVRTRLGAEREHSGRFGRVTTGMSGGTFCLWLNGELCWTERHADFYRLTRGHVRQLLIAMGMEGAK